MSGLFEVLGRDVGGDRAYILAEVGHNHQGDVETARELIKQAALAGADAVKTQIRTNRELYTSAFYNRAYDSENSYGPTYGKHREYLELPPDAHRELKDFANSLGLAYFATPFDFGALDLCYELDLPAIKIASGSVTNVPLLIQAARTGLPIFMSTGACHIEDVKRAVDAIRTFNDKLCILQCTATYPNEASELDLGVIHTYAWRFPECVIGHSSHFAGISDGPVAYTLGARVFEKHVTLSRSMKGTDHAFSLEPNGLRRYIRDIHRCEEMIGDGRKRKHLSEADAAAKMQSSIYTTRKLPAGHVIEPKDVCIKSPAAYIPPYELSKVIGQEVVLPLEDEQPLSWEVLSEHVERSRTS